MRRVLLLCAICSLSFGRASATWTLVGSFPVRATCGYFFNDSVGLVGCGDAIASPSHTADIRKTTNGGLIWTDCILPTQQGRISSIFMRDSMDGYASVMFSSHPLWQTTDGGNTWQFFAEGGTGDATCVFQTPSALIKTAWSNVGGSLLNGAGMFSQDFFGQLTDWSNGIAFLDDLNGVVTMGPDITSGNTSSLTYYTRDGGQTWHPGGVLKEAWGMFADKQSGEFFVLPECNEFTPGNILYRSQDGGVTWQTVPATGLPADGQYTGHIAGMGNMLYVQSSSESSLGLFRSDDGGVTWNNVGGPSNQRDTRFCVAGCMGAVLYAFDSLGAVWKSVDGGDGSVSTPTQSASLFLKGESITAHAGDTLEIPVYLSGNATLGATSIMLPFGLDTNVLRPIGFQPAIVGMTVGSISFGVGTGTVPLQLSGLNLNGDTLIGTLRCVVYLADTLATSITLQNASLNSATAPCTALSLTTDSVNILINGCGDETLLQFMKSGRITFGIQSITPNPASNEIDIVFESDLSQPISYELIDALGHTRLHDITDEHIVSLDASSLPQGIYFFRASTTDGFAVTRKVVVEH